MLYNHNIRTCFFDVFGGFDLKKVSLDLNKKVALIASAVATVIIAAVLCVLFFFLGKNNSEQAKAVNTQSTALKVDNGPFVDMTEVSTLEMRGMWIASTINIDYPSKQGLSETELKAELEAIVDNAFELGVNSLFFQVRPACDALYNSEIFPASRYVSGTQGETVNGFDSLAYIIEYAKKYNIDVHAWINPYRVSMNEAEMDSLASTNPAAIHPEYTVSYDDGKTYLNPGLPEVRDLVVSGVTEIVENYPDIAGVHFDDYFYPYPVTGGVFDDSAAYAAYSEGMELSDWRRNNVNMLIEQTYHAVKEINPDCVFGVSVFGIWANSGSDTPVKGSETKGLESYFSTYCDALTWANGGYVDYIAPQDYWSFDTTVAPFDDVARWWNANLDGTGVDLYIGHAAYKSADYEENEILKQIEMCRTLSCYKGSILYGYENIKGNIGGVADDMKTAFEYKVLRSAAQSNGKVIKINFPDNNSYVSTSKTYMLGSCDPAYPLYLNGEAVSKTKGGYFGLYLDVSGGKNTYTFTQNGKTVTHVLNGPGSSSSGNYYYSDNSLDSMQVLSPYPQGATWLGNGDKLSVSCVAPAGSVVTAKLGETEVVLSPTIYPSGSGKYLYEEYKGTIKPDVLVNDTDFKVLGNVVFTAELDGETAQTEGGEIAQKGIDSYVYAEVKNDYTHTKVGTSSSFYDDFLPSSKGMRDYVTSASNGYCKLRFGGYVKEENLEFTYGKPLLLNTILTTAVEVNDINTLNNKNNSTDIRFGVTENIPVDVDFRGENGAMRIIIYNTDTSIIPQFDVPANPLIESIEGKLGTRDNMLMYHVTLKDNTNFYGFRIVYEDGCMIVKLNNPQTLAQGDKPLSGKRIVVDAGHGGTDVGAVGPGDCPEKDLNRMIAECLVTELEDLGAEIIITRKDDETVDLYQRMDMLTEECPDMAVSIHHNSVLGSSNALKARGFMALYSNNSGVSLSDTIADVVCKKLVRDKKPTAYQALAVARNHMFPSTLLEMCFISNVEEYEWSVTEGNAERSAKAIAEGIIEYYKNQEQYLDY
ncbi:MAG: hypothetical protein E7600_07205 [Ruminococcaceae bacterium]|nr:hypothetical protein [Oscillospiraceae bacterium]